MIQRTYGIDGGRPPPTHYFYYSHYFTIFTIITITPDLTLITQVFFLYMSLLTPYCQSFLLTHF